MNHYDEFLKTLPLDAANYNEFCAHKLPLTMDDTGNVLYYKINDTDACAIVTGFSKDRKDIIIESEVCSEGVMDLTYTASTSTIPVRMVYFHNSNNRDYFDIPETVWSILGAENVNDFYGLPFGLDNNPNFECKVGLQGTCIWSKDREDLIYGRLDGCISNILKGVKTIHNLAYKDIPIEELSMIIPASVERIFKIRGDFSSVIFEGKLPEFAEGALKDVSIEDISVYSRYRENNPNAIKALMMVPKNKDTHRYGKDYWRRTEENTLFAPAEPVIKTPEAKGYIALTNARFDCDGDPVLINTQFIATICPKTVRRCDYKAEGSTILIGLEKDGQETRGIWYDVYEDPDLIDSLIADAQN